jgi:Mn2+/Fe2+ NRAMP family transporter
VFAIVLLDASIIGAAAVTLASSYAFGDVFGLKHSLHRGFADARPFYLSYTGMVVLAAAIVLIPGAPAGFDHHRRASAGRIAVAQRHRIPAAAVQ